MTSNSDTLSFICDEKEALTPDGFLTPVYFNKQVLVRYFYDSRFTCEFVSDTYGTVYGDEFYISFGINPNGSVIVWLGDLHKLPKREKCYWLVENKEPEGNIESEFKEAQLNVKYTDPPEAIRCLNSVEKLNNAFYEKHEVHLYKPQPFELRLEATIRYKRVLLNNEDDLKRFVSELNEIINENTNNAGLRNLLKSIPITIESGMKGNKLLQKVYEHILGDTKNLIAPFYYLYDLRLWSDHTGLEGKYAHVLTKLGLDANSSRAEVLSALLTAILSSCEQLYGKINA